MQDETGRASNFSLLTEKEKLTFRVEEILKDQQYTGTMIADLIMSSEKVLDKHKE